MPSLVVERVLVGLPGVGDQVRNVALVERLEQLAGDEFAKDVRSQKKMSNCNCPVRIFASASSMLLNVVIW